VVKGLQSSSSTATPFVNSCSGVVDLFLSEY
jgi:hypothetical protein